MAILSSFSICALRAAFSASSFDARQPMGAVLLREAVKRLETKLNKSRRSDRRPFDFFRLLSPVENGKFSLSVTLTLQPKWSLWLQADVENVAQISFPADSPFELQVITGVYEINDVRLSVCSATKRTRACSPLIQMYALNLRLFRRRNSRFQAHATPTPIWS